MLKRHAKATMKRRAFLRYGAIGFAATLAPAAGVRPSPASAPAQAEIVSCAIHPAIGVARAGNSPDGYFLGPELPGVYPVPDGGYKDAVGRVKRQAARFRVYGLDADGNVVRELTADDAEIVWTVHPANTKAAWYTFDMALDIAEAQGGRPLPDGSLTPPVRVPRRNAAVTGADRARLAIDAGPRTIAGASVNAAGDDRRYAFDDGRFFDRPVPLGELRTDAAGRLIVLGGFGAAGGATPDLPLGGGPNSDGWHDDLADGPVDAVVRIGDRVLQATGAWVVVAPPNYAPGIQSVTTMYDVVFDAAMRLEPSLRPPRPSFTRQIYPLLARHAGQQWVNAGFAWQFGWGAPDHFLAPAYLALLADPTDAGKPARQALFDRFRDPAAAGLNPALLPPLFGDAPGIPPRTPNALATVLPSQYDWLRRWAAGDFDADWAAERTRPVQRLDDLPPEEQPGALDRAALDACVGAALHPGIELTWPMRQPLLYDAPFRIRRRTGAERDWGDALTPAVALAADGPLAASGPGDLTRWLAVPWQPDIAGCLSARAFGDTDYLPAYWPARAPNEVLTAQSYAQLMDQSASIERRWAAFTSRAAWLRDLPPLREDPLAFILAVTRDWSRLGIVAPLPGPAGADAFPTQLWVEQSHDLPPRPDPAAASG